MIFENQLVRKSATFQLFDIRRYPFVLNLVESQQFDQVGVQPLGLLLQRETLSGSALC